MTGECANYVVPSKKWGGGYLIKVYSGRGSLMDIMTMTSPHTIERLSDHGTTIRLPYNNQIRLLEYGWVDDFIAGTKEYMAVWRQKQSMPKQVNVA